jgi:hypothetical protein
VRLLALELEFVLRGDLLISLRAQKKNARTDAPKRWRRSKKSKGAPRRHRRFLNLPSPTKAYKKKSVRRKGQ